MNVEPIYIGCDHAANYDGAQDPLSGTYLNSGTCTWKLTDTLGNQLGTGACTYQSASNGNYQGIVPASLTSTLTEGTYYWLWFEFNQAGADYDQRRENVIALYRGFT